MEISSLPSPFRRRRRAFRPVQSAVLAAALFCIQAQGRMRPQFWERDQTAVSLPACSVSSVATQSVPSLRYLLYVGWLAKLHRNDRSPNLRLPHEYDLYLHRHPTSCDARTVHRVSLQRYR